MDHKKEWVFVAIIALGLVLSASSVSANITEWIDQVRAGITGHATSQSVSVNVSVGNTAPVVVAVTAISAQNPTESGTTPILFNFTAYDADGLANLNTTGSNANFTRSGEATRQNATCTQLNTFATNYANYSCTIDMWYFDSQGSWTVTAEVKDINNARSQNSTTSFTFNQLSAFTTSPSALTWASLSPGQTNQSSNNDPLVLNNTGNKNITDGNIQINATNLRGEADNTKAIWAANISASIISGGAYECGISSNMTRVMSPSVFEYVSNATLPRGNYSLNDGTAQENVYVCIRLIGNELSSQAYSTSNEGSWTVKIV